MTQPLGLPAHRVDLCPYNPTWARLFDEEAARICGALGDWILDVQHVGSTSIPNIPAKPILDIAVAVENFEEAACCIAPLEALGYEYLGENGIPRRHYFRKRNPATDTFTHNLHMNETHGDDYRGHVAFRNYLRTHSDVAQEYADLKLSLKARFPSDRRAYGWGKAAFINKVLCRTLPEMLPRVGDVVTCRAYKSDATNYRWWQATIEAVVGSEIVALAAPPRIVHQPSGDWHSRTYARQFFWLDKPYNLIEFYEAGGSLIDLYINIGSPVLIKNNELHYTDFELDVACVPGEEPRILDEDEFTTAAGTFGYSAEFQARCYEVTREAVELARRWQPRGIDQV